MGADHMGETSQNISTSETNIPKLFLPISLSFQPEILITHAYTKYL